MSGTVRKTVNSTRSAISRAAESLLRWLTASVVRSTAIFVILTFVPILLLTYYIILSSISTARAEAARTDAQTRDAVVALLRASFHGEVNSLSAMSDAAPLQAALARTSPDYQEVSDVLVRLARRNHDLSFLGIYNLDGSLIGATPDAPLDPSAQDLPWFQAPVKFQGWYISTLQPAIDTQPPSVLIGGPLDVNDRLSAVLVAGLPVSVINAWVRRMSGPEHSIYVLDNALHAITQPSDPDLLPLNVLPQLPEVRQALAGQSGSGEYISPFHVHRLLITYGAISEARVIVLVARPVGVGTYLISVFYDKLALIAVIVFALAVISGLLLRSAFQYYLRYTREVETGRSKTKALLTSIGDGVFAVDADLRIIEFNRAAANLTGMRPEEVIGKPYYEVIKLVDEASGRLAADPVRQAVEQRRNLRLLRELSLVRVDGSRIPVSVSAAPVVAEDGQVAGCVVVFSDVSQEREVDRMKTEFISIASHQLRTPMSGVKGALALVLEGVLGPLNREQQDYVRRAYEANERLISLANVLLNIGRIEQGKLQLNLEPLDVSRLLEAIAEEYRPRAARYQQELTLELPPQHLAVYADRVRLREVIANLVDNAIKYTPEHGRVTIRLREQPRTELPDMPEGSHGSDQVVIEVTDTGVGISKDRIPQLFQKFTRIPNPLSTRESGSGLGLYFARSIIQLHHGWIDVSSEPGKGSTFRVFLPKYISPATTEERELRPAESVKTHS